jgi:hypothetical protein
MTGKKFAVACGQFLKSAPEGLFKKSHDLYGYATVEVPDADGDIVRVDGIRLNYFKSAGSIPLLMQHRNKLLENGEPPTVGVVTEFVKCEREIAGRKFKAMAFGAEWEREGDSFSPNASKYKSRYDQGTLSTFSLGFDTFAVDQTYKGRGMDITESDPFELSCCVVPVNRYATVMRRLKAEMGDEFDADELNEARIAALHGDLVTIIEMQKSSESLFNKLIRKLDDVESAIVAASEGRETKPTSNRTVSSIDIAGLQKTLNELSKQLV